ncbi:MAG: glycosyltransferase family 4 protein [Actinomycetota bacterium]
MEEKIKVLFISSLFPNTENPTSAMFNKQQIMYLSELCEIKVVAPIVWFPFLKKEKISYHEFLGEIEVFHPKAFYIPKLARFLYGLFYFLSIIRCIKKILKAFDFEIIYTNWLYPDSFAAMLIAKLFQKPFVACALGTDVNVYMKYPLRKRMILATIRKSAKTLTVSNALKEKIVEQGIPSEHIEVLYDGVDKKIFSPQDKNRAKESLGLEKTSSLILYVGNLKFWKGIDYLIDAMKILVNQKERITLCLIGDGLERKSIENKVMKLNLCNNIFLKGIKPHKDISLWMNAADLLCLPSLMEGVPNVILEAWACGIPVVATKVGGIPEILSDPDYGIMVEPQDAISLAQALSVALNKNWDKEKIKQYSLRFSWEENAKKLFRILELEITRSMGKLEKNYGHI